MPFRYVSSFTVERVNRIHLNRSNFMDFIYFDFSVIYMSLDLKLWKDFHSICETLLRTQFVVITRAKKNHGNGLSDFSPSRQLSIRVRIFFIQSWCRRRVDPRPLALDSFCWPWLQCDWAALGDHLPGYQIRNSIHFLLSHSLIK